MNLIKSGKKLTIGLLACSMMFSLAACTGKKADDAAAGTDKKEKGGIINVISREQGSGTRGAFTEITKILAKNDKGEEVDSTSPEAVVQNSTDGVMTAVANDENAIGYISLGSLNDTVKAVKVEGVEPNAENIKNGKYKLSRPFNVVYTDKVSEDAKDFLKYIESDEGQKIAADSGYVPEAKGIKYEAKDSKAKLTIAGSTSVTPLMEKLVEGYKKLNPGFSADIQATGSSAGIKSTLDGSADLGMASRSLKDSEKSLKVDIIAMDGIAVIVNKKASVEDLTMENIKNVFQGKTTNWTELNGK